MGIVGGSVTTRTMPLPGRPTSITRAGAKAPATALAPGFWLPVAGGAVLPSELATARSMRWGAATSR
ncbi:hypothetical protein D9M72_155250 [compost metagenome]